MDEEREKSLVQAATDVTELIVLLSLSNTGAIDRVPKLLNTERTKRLDEYAADVRARLAAESADDGEMIGQITVLINRDMAATATVKSALAAIMDEVRQDLATGLSRAESRVDKHIQQCLDGSGRIQAAEQSLATLLYAADTAIAASDGQKSHLEQMFAELCSSFCIDGVAASDSRLRDFLRQYCMLLACQLVCQCVGVHLRSLRESLRRQREEKLRALRTRVCQLSAASTSTLVPGTPIPDQLLAAFDEFLVSQGRFRLSVLQHQEVSASDTSTLTREAANFLMQTFDRSASRSKVSAGGAAPTSFPGNTRPLLRNVGGGQRVLAAIPEGISPETWLAQLQNEFGQCVSVVSMNREDICVICETEGIAVSSVINSLSHLKPKVMELAGRLHSRQDIPW